MLILALDSATAGVSLALWRDGAVLASDAADAGRSDALPAAVAALMARAGLGLAALDRLAVTIGPGRFTGLRAGLAFMRGLALALDRPLIGLTTLEALAALRPLLEQAGLQVGVSQLQAWRGAPLADGTRLAPLNPVLVLRGRRLPPAGQGR